MVNRPLKIVLLFDVLTNLREDEIAEYLKTEDWKTHENIRASLKKLGHEVTLFGLYDKVDELISILKNGSYDLVFNIGEGIFGDRTFEPHVATLLEIFKIPYTGSGSEALHLCKDKGLTKKILTFHRIPVPAFVVSLKRKPLRSLKSFRFPALIKPLNLEGSEGIAQLSFVENESEAMERIRYINEKLEVDAIVEEYIDGREFYVSVMGNEKLQVFPPRELHFRNVPEGEPRIATFKAKWDEEYRKKWGIQSASAGSLEAALMQKIENYSKKIYKLLRMKGYGRIDFRLKENGDLYFLEANPNPALSREDDFPLSAQKSGMGYSEMISKILSLALSREN